MNLIFKRVENQVIKNSSPKARSVRTLKQWIRQGQLIRGEQLPTESELARLLNVSRTTVRAAVKVIEEEGLLHCNENRRRIVVGPAQPSGGLVADTVAILTHLTDPPADDLPQAQTGWERYIQIGLIDSLHVARMHALTLHIDLLQNDLIQTLINHPPRGLIVLHPSLHPSASLKLAIALRDKGVPVVSYGFTDLAKFDTVASDSAAGCYALTNWLISRGHRRLLRIWPSSRKGDQPKWLCERSIGFEQAITKHGLELLPIAGYPDLWNPQLDTREHFELRARLMVGYLVEHLNGPKPVDALLALTDGDCYAIAAACRILGKEPNRDIAIVGYDNYWQESPDGQWEVCRPLATVDKLNINLGHELTSLLLARLEGKLPQEPQLRLIQPELKVIE